MRRIDSPLVVWLTIVVLGVLLRPIAADSVWWEISRGWAVWQGKFLPSLSLLDADVTADADWLGGLPFAAAYSLFDSHGLMLLKIAGGLMVAVCSWRIGRERNVFSPELPTGLVMISAAAAFDATTRLWDVVGLVLLWRTFSSSQRQTPLSHCVVPRWLEIVGTSLKGDVRSDTGLVRQGFLCWPALLILMIWSQFASLVIVGWSAFVIARIMAARGLSVAEEGRRSCWVVLLASVACSLTPRGVFTLWDSLRIAVPRLVADGATLGQTEWQPLLNATWSLPEWAFAVLTTLAFLTLLWRPPGGSVTFQVLAAAMLGWTNHVAMPVAATWLLLLMLSWPNEPAASAEFAKVFWNQRICAVLVGWLRVGMVVVAWLPWTDWRCGWGLDSRLEERLLADTLAKLSLDGTAWADDVHSAGMCSWVTNGRLKPYDVPQRALLGGRLRDFVLLRRDLEAGRLSRYRREDGTSGGWWLPLRQRRTELVLVTAERTRLIRSLEPTIWKPLVLDSPVLAYGRAGEKTVSPQIVNVLKQRKFVESGAWSSSLLGATGTDRSLDVWGFLGVSSNVEQELRQSRVFRAMQLPRAGLRMLLPALRVSQRASLLHEFALCNRDLGETELKQFGWLSRWRTLLSLESPERRPTRVGRSAIGLFVRHWAKKLHLMRPESETLREDLAKHRVEFMLGKRQPPGPEALRLPRLFGRDDPSESILSQVTHGWLVAAQATRRADFATARVGLPAIDPSLSETYESAYARVCLAWDAGDMDRWKDELKQLATLALAKGQAPEAAEVQVRDWARNVVESFEKNESR